LLESGYPDWELIEYKQFFKAFKRRDIEDVEGIASEIPTKSIQEVASYLHTFLQRFRELKERDEVMMKF